MKTFATFPAAAPEWGNADEMAEMVGCAWYPIIMVQLRTDSDICKEFNVSWIFPCVEQICVTWGEDSVVEAWPAGAAWVSDLETEDEAAARRRAEVNDRDFTQNGVWRYASEEASYNPRSRNPEWFDEDEEDDEDEQGASAADTAAAGQATTDAAVEEELQGTSSVDETPSSSSNDPPSCSPTSPAVDYD